MRVLQICSARSIGGGERYLADLSNSLAKRGHEVFAVLAPDSPVEKELHEIPKDNILYSRMRNAADIPSAFEIAKFARKTGAEIIHAHVARDFPLAAIANKRSGIPFVLTRHLLFPLKQLQKIALKNIGGIIAPSKAIADALKRQSLFPIEKIVTITHGVDEEHYKGTAKTDDDTFIVGTIGHLGPIKGNDIFVRAAEIVLKTHPEIRFVLVGEDRSASGKDERELKKLIENLNLQDKVELAGWTDDIRPFLSDFDLFVSAAREEAFGLVMVEAMMSQTPVLAVRNEGALEIIEDGISGILVPLGDHQELAAKILKLYEDRSLLKTLSTNGRNHAIANFSFDVMIEKTEQFYASVIAGSI